MSKLMIIGDPHCGAASVSGKPSIGNQLNSRVIDQFNLLEWCLNKAIENEVSVIAITGDVFDDPKPQSAIVVLFIEWLKKCSDAGISVHILLGNHDLLRSGHHQMSALDIISAAEIENVFVHKTISSVHMEGVSFTMLPFRDRRSFNVSTHDEAINILQGRLPYEIAEINRNHMKIVIGHLAIAGSIPALNEIDDTINELFCPVSMFKDYDYTFCGHIHKPQILSKKPFVAHIGSLDISDFGEKDQDKFIVIVDPDSSKHYRYIEIPTRKLNQISISVPVDITDTTVYVLQELKADGRNFAKSIAKVNITLNNPDVVSVDRSVIEKYLGDIGVFHTAGVQEERKVIQVKRAELEGLDNTVNESVAIQMFAKVSIDEEIRDDFIVLANDIVKECAA